MFADDIKLYQISRSLEDCLQLQRDIGVLVQWSKTWLFSFIVNKCKVLHISNTVIQCNRCKMLNLNSWKTCKTWEFILTLN